ncbi:MAG: tRNA pseudouridine(55) synthase TruB [Clostridia bacterium]|nr:tRNA pseudouridine(55) synthase TruB [Clostridia bacterium]
MVNGVINIYKEQNYTSQDVVAILRKKLGIKKIGHTGTLDPMAQGVLPLCINKATRIMDYLDYDLKVYRCICKLGLETDTLDIWGNILEEKKIPTLSKEDVIKAFQIGFIEQIPPKFSALKFNGKKLYEYARAGIELPDDIKKRKTYIKSMDLLSFDGENIEFRVVCSKGTYVRSICHDLGVRLGTCGTMSYLEREASGVFTQDDAISIEKIKDMDINELLSHIKVTEYPLDKLGKIVVPMDHTGSKFITGMHIPPAECISITPGQFDEEIPKLHDHLLDEKFCVFNENGSFLGVAYYSHQYHKYVADKVFYEE